MTQGNLIKRATLQFEQTNIEILEDLSGAVFDQEGFLWLASDETTIIERLNKTGENVYGNHQRFPLKDFLLGFEHEDGEVDIESLSYDEGYLWVVGSHSSKRKKVKHGEVERLKIIENEKNRYVLGRIPVEAGQLTKKTGEKTAAYLDRTTAKSNVLIEALKLDPYFQDILAINLPSKDNGLDIEGLAVKGDQIFLGLRGPVLRGMSIVIEVIVEEKTPGILTLKEIGLENCSYKKHFLDLDGLGIRDLCLWGEDIIILSGPTMDLDGSLRLFRWKQPHELADLSFSDQETKTLEFLFEIPHGYKTDKAEGMTLLNNEENTLLVVYDSPDPSRIIDSTSVEVDVFSLD